MAYQKLTMGTWGTAIFSDDFASDIKDEFRDKVAFGKSPKEATNEIIADYSNELTDSEDSCVFWLALATTQWTLGRLQDNVKLKALEIIDNGQDLARWTSDKKEYQKRQTVLNKLKLKLQSEQPAPKKLATPFIRETKMEVGDFLTYKHVSGKIAVFRVLNIEQDHCGDRYPQIEILDYFDNNQPKSNILKKVKPKIKSNEQNDAFASRIKHSGTYYVTPYGKRDSEPWNKLETIEKRSSSSGELKGSVSMIWWRDFDQFLNELFEKK